MTDYTDLISRLRICEKYDPDQKEAAEALEAQTREFEAKCKECSDLKIELAKWVNYWRDKDNKALQARIAELEERIDAFEMDAGHAAARIAELEVENEQFMELLTKFANVNADMLNDILAVRATLEKKND